MKNGEAPNNQPTIPKGKTAAEIEKIIVRGSRIMELRRDGKSFRQISKILKEEAQIAGRSVRGFGYVQISQHYKALADLRLSEQQETVDEIRMLSAERLEHVLAQYMPYAELKIGPLTSKNEVRMKIKAGDVVVKAVTELAELYGAKRPQRIDLGGEIGVNWSDIAAKAKESRNLTDEVE